MRNGIYQKCIELKIVAYDLDDSVVAIITNEKHPGEPMFLTGDNAINLIEDLSKHLEPGIEGS